MSLAWSLANPIELPMAMKDDAASVAINSDIPYDSIDLELNSSNLDIMLPKVTSATFLTSVKLDDAANALSDRATKPVKPAITFNVLDRFCTLPEILFNPLLIPAVSTKVLIVIEPSYELLDIPTLLIFHLIMLE